jgi:hypothetical protein
MEVGCMQDSVKNELNNVIDLMDYIPEIMILIIIVLMFIACIGLGIGKAMKKWEDRNGG